MRGEARPQPVGRLAHRGHRGLDKGWGWSEGEGGVRVRAHPPRPRGRHRRCHRHPRKPQRPRGLPSASSAVILGEGEGEGGGEGEGKRSLLGLVHEAMLAPCLGGDAISSVGIVSSIADLISTVGDAILALRLVKMRPSTRGR